MYKFLSTCCLFLAVVGAFFVMLWDMGSGLDSPGIWFIPVGVTGILIATARIGHKRMFTVMSFAWALSLLSILGLYYGWFTEGFEGFIWLFPAVGFTFISFILLIVETTRILIHKIPSVS